MAEATPHVRRRAASGDADKTVPGLETALIEILSTGGLQILESLGTAQQCGGTTSQHTLNQLRITAEGWRAFSGIQHTEPP